MCIKTPSNRPLEFPFIIPYISAVNNSPLHWKSISDNMNIKVIRVFLLQNTDEIFGIINENINGLLLGVDHIYVFKYTTKGGYLFN